jgi:hypothetical protein
MIRVLLVLLPLALAIYAFIDCLGTEENRVRGLPKVVWVIIILLFPLLGPIGWLAAGRPKREYAAGGGAGGGGFGFGGRNQARRHVAPDDNPEFLASLNKDRPEPTPPTPADDEAEMLKRWEEDLKHREDDLRSPDQDNPEGRTKD